MLDNGVLLCQLAKLIQERAEQAVAAGLTSPVRLNYFILLYLFYFFFLINFLSSLLYL